jgi:hypothetical protein
MREHLGVGVPAELVTGLEQPLPQCRVVVDLAIEGRPDRAILVRARLPAILEVDDAEPGRSEGDPVAAST